MLITPDIPNLLFTIKNGVKYFELVAEPVKRELLPGLYINAWGYNGSTPGPTIQVCPGLPKAQYRQLKSLLDYGAVVPQEKKKGPGRGFFDGLMGDILPEKCWRCRLPRQQSPVWEPVDNSDKQHRAKQGN